MSDTTLESDLKQTRALLLRDILCFVAVSASAWVACSQGATTWMQATGLFEGGTWSLLAVVLAASLGFVVVSSPRSAKPRGLLTTMVCVATLLVVTPEFALTLQLEADPDRERLALTISNEDTVTIDWADGTVLPYYGLVSKLDDSSWLECDGREIPIEDYDRLFEIIGSAYGAGEAGKFRIPDLRGLYVHDYESAHWIHYGNCAIAKPDGPLPSRATIPERGATSPWRVVWIIRATRTTWGPDTFSIELKRAENRSNQILSVRRRPTEKHGTTHLEIDIEVPASWSITKIEWDQERLKLTRNDGREFWLPRSTWWKLFIATKDGGDKSQAELERLWTKHAGRVK